MNKEELFAALQEEWAAVPNSYFNKLVERMPRRVGAVIVARCAGTKY